MIGGRNNCSCLTGAAAWPVQLNMLCCSYSDLTKPNQAHVQHWHSGMQWAMQGGHLQALAEPSEKKKKKKKTFKRSWTWRAWSPEPWACLHPVRIAKASSGNYPIARPSSQVFRRPLVEPPLSRENLYHMCSTTHWSINPGKAASGRNP